LVFHIGAGKTGTSSIQHTLLDQRAELTRRGYWYLGLMLEHATNVRFPWQQTLASEVFHSMDADTASAQLTEVLKSVVSDARREGIHTLIWSNESFFRRNGKTHGALAELQRDGVGVFIIAYVRRHDAWARSAYVQWGIKHKTYTGPVQPFSLWIGSRYPSFGADLLRLKQTFPGGVAVRNLDGIGDAVTDFLEQVGLDPSGITQVRANETPTGVELVMRALFNNTFQGEVLPVVFERSVGNATDFSTPVSNYFNQLMPSEADLEMVKQQCADDRRILDDLLMEQGQLPIETAPLSMRPISLDREALIKSLCEIVMKQSTRLIKLEKQVTELNKVLFPTDVAQK